MDLGRLSRIADSSLVGDKIKDLKEKFQGMWDSLTPEQRENIDRVYALLEGGSITEVQAMDQLSEIQAAMGVSEQPPVDEDVVEGGVPAEEPVEAQPVIPKQ